MTILAGRNGGLSVRAAVLGAGAQGRVVVDILRASRRHDEIAIVDDNEALWGQTINGVQVIGSWRALVGAEPPWAVHIAIGAPTLRLALAAELEAHGLAPLTARHPSATVSETAAIGAGSTLSAQSVVNPNAVLESHVLVNTAAIIEHDVHLAAGATVCPGAVIGGRTRVGQRAFVGSGAVVLQRLTVGAGSVIAAGSVVTRDVPADVLVMGTPARVVRAIAEDFEWGRLL